MPLTNTRWRLDGGLAVVICPSFPEQFTVHGTEFTGSRFDQDFSFPVHSLIVSRPRRHDQPALGPLGCADRRHVCGSEQPEVSQAGSRPRCLREYPLGYDNYFSPVMDVEFSDYVVHVRLHRAYRHAEMMRNDLVLRAVPEHVQHSHLSRG